MINFQQKGAVRTNRRKHSSAFPTIFGQSGRALVTFLIRSSHLDGVWSPLLLFPQKIECWWETKWTLKPRLGLTTSGFFCLGPVIIMLALWRESLLNCGYNNNLQYDASSMQALHPKKIVILWYLTKYLTHNLGSFFHQICIRGWELATYISESSSIFSSLICFVILLYFFSTVDFSWLICLTDCFRNCLAGSSGSDIILMLV